MDDRIASSPPHILQLVTHDRLGGVRTLVRMVEAGLRTSGFVVDTLALNSDRGAAALGGDLLRVSRAILSGRYDAILTYQAAASVFGGLLGWARRTPLRVAHQTAAPEAIRAHWKVLDRWFGSRGIYTHIVSNSASTSASFAAWPKPYLQRFVLIPHGVDPIGTPAEKLDWRRQLGISAGALVLVATGRLADQKNYAVAVEALPQLAGAHLVIAGDGPNHDALIGLAERLHVADRLHLVGPMDRAEIGNLFMAGDIYLFPSIWETFGLAGVEAAMAGLPIVASDLPVLREVLEIAPGADELVRFHAPHDAEGLAAAVTSLAAHYPTRELRDAFAARHRERHGRARMIEHYRDFILDATRR